MSEVNEPRFFASCFFPPPQKKSAKKGKVTLNWPILKGPLNKFNAPDGPGGLSYWRGKVHWREGKLEDASCALPLPQPRRGAAFPSARSGRPSSGGSSAPYWRQASPPPWRQRRAQFARVEGPHPGAQDAKKIALDGEQPITGTRLRCITKFCKTGTVFNSNRMPYCRQFPDFSYFAPSLDSSNLSIQ